MTCMSSLAVALRPPWAGGIGDAEVVGIETQSVCISDIEPIFLFT